VQRIITIQISEKISQRAFTYQEKDKSVCERWEIDARGESLKFTEDGIRGISLAVAFDIGCNYIDFAWWQSKAPKILLHAKHEAHPHTHRTG
jgi:hypothetical protein